MTAPVVLAAAAGPLDGVAWSAHPGAYLALLAGLAVLAVLSLASLVSLLGAVAPTVRAAADRQARSTSPGWACVVGALVAVGVLLVLSWASKAGETPAAVALLVLGVPSALALVAGALAVVPLLGERSLGARGLVASPFVRALAGSLVCLAALAGSVALGPLAAVVLAVVLGWPLGVGLSTALSRRRPPAPPAA